jgi:hypothetical protein
MKFFRLRERALPRSAGSGGLPDVLRLYSIKNSLLVKHLKMGRCGRRKSTPWALFPLFSI